MTATSMRGLLEPFLLLFPAGFAQAQNPALIWKYCSACHNSRLKTGGISLAGLDGDFSFLAEKARRSTNATKRKR